jgi:hypothetical protein
MSPRHNAPARRDGQKHHPEVVKPGHHRRMRVIEIPPTQDTRSLPAAGTICNPRPRGVHRWAPPVVIGSGSRNAAAAPARDTGSAAQRWQMPGRAAAGPWPRRWVQPPPEPVASAPAGAAPAPGSAVRRAGMLSRWCGASREHKSSAPVRDWDRGRITWRLEHVWLPQCPNRQHALFSARGIQI